MIDIGDLVISGSAFLALVSLGVVGTLTSDALQKYKDLGREDYFWDIWKEELKDFVLPRKCKNLLEFLEYMRENKSNYK